MCWALSSPLEVKGRSFADLYVDQKDVAFGTQCKSGLRFYALGMPEGDSDFGVSPGLNEDKLEDIDPYKRALVVLEDNF